LLPDDRRGRSPVVSLSGRLVHSRDAADAATATRARSPRRVNRVRQIAGRIARSRDLRRLFLAYFVFNAVEYGTWIAFLVYAYEALGPASVGVVAVLLLIPCAVAAPAVAALGDRYPRQRVLTGGYLAYGLGLSVAAAAMVAGAPVPIVVGVAALGSAALVVVRPTQTAMLPSLSQTPDELAAANGAAGIVEGAGILVGPLVAAVALANGGPPLVVVLAATALLAAGILIAQVGGLSRPIPGVAKEASGPRRAGRSVLADVMRGVRTVGADRDARLVVGLMSARSLMIGAADVLFVLMALDLLGMGEPGAAILQAALGAGVIAGGASSFVLFGRNRLASVAAGGACVWGIALAASAWLASPGIAVLLIVAGGAGLAIVDVAGRTILQRSVRDEVLASVFGVQEGLSMSSLAVGAVLVPALIALFGLTSAVLVMAAGLPVVVALIWSQLVGLDARTPVPTQAIALLRRVSLFAPLPAPELEAIARRAAWQTFEPDQQVIREGDAGDRYFVLASGAVTVERGGRPLRELREPGDGFGEIALLRDIPRTATVTTQVESVFLTVDRATFLAAVTGDPQTHARADGVVASATM